MEEWFASVKAEAISDRQMREQARSSLRRVATPFRGELCAYVLAEQRARGAVLLALAIC